MSGNYNYTNGREWMYNRVYAATENFTAEFMEGVDKHFIPFANSQPFTQSNGGKLHCPCDTCKNDKRLMTERKIQKHLYRNRFMPDYYVWYKHGEKVDMGLGTSYADTTLVSGSEGLGNVVEVRYVDMVNDAFRDNVHFDNYHQYIYQNVEEHGSYPNVDELVRNHSKKFYDLLKGANNPLYDGCREGHSQLSLAARVMQKKAEHNMSERAVDSICEMFTKYLTEGNQAIDSHYATEKLMRNLGLSCHLIDVCFNNCMIFWKDNESLDKCRFCNSPRWKPNEQRRRTNIPYSHMWYMPIADKLKSMYQSEKTTTAMRWHAEHQAKEGEMCHPSDAAEWKYFQDQYPMFAQETRNVYLGLCTNGFNPFGMSNNHLL